MLDGNNPNTPIERTKQNIKILLVGDQDSGDFSLLTRFLYDSFFDKSLYSSHENFLLTKGIIQPTRKYIDVGNYECQLAILTTNDISNLKRSATSNYYEEPHVMMICCDVTKPNSFDSIEKHIKSNRDSYVINHSTQIIVVATKCDLINQRAISTEQAQAYCKNHKFDYIETSSKNFFQVHEAFQLASMHAICRSRDYYDDSDEMQIALDLDRYKPEKTALHTLCDKKNNCNNTVLLIGDEDEKINFINALVKIDYHDHHQLSVRINGDLLHIINFNRVIYNEYKHPLNTHGRLINHPEYSECYMNFSTQAAAYIYIGATDEMKNTFENIRMINLCYINTVALDFDKMGIGAKECMEVIYPTLKEQQNYFKHNQLLMIMANVNDKGSIFSLLPKELIMEICRNAYSLVETSTICTSVPKKILDDRTLSHLTKQLDYLLDNKAIGPLLKRNVSISGIKMGLWGKQTNLYDYLKNMIQSTDVKENQKAQDIIFCLKNHNIKELVIHLNKRTNPLDPTTPTGMKIWKALGHERDYIEIISNVNKLT